jgi:hypothetical protein
VAQERVGAKGKIMTRKSGIKPPPTPKFEDPYVTLSIQDKQIDALVNRIAELGHERDSFRRMHEMSEAHERSMQEILDKTCKDFDEQVKAYTRLLGWQDCAREMIDKLSGK